MNVDDVVAAKVEAARVRIQAARRRREELSAARRRGLAARHAARLRNLAAGRTPEPGVPTPETTEENPMVTTDREQLAQDTAEYIANEIVPRYSDLIIRTDNQPTTVEGIKAALLDGDVWLSWVDARTGAALRILHGPPADASTIPTTN